jgi:hypothetical protein
VHFLCDVWLEGESVAVGLHFCVNFTLSNAVSFEKLLFDSTKVSDIWPLSRINTSISTKNLASDCFLIAKNDELVAWDKNKTSRLWSLPVPSSC